MDQGAGLHDQAPGAKARTRPWIVRGVPKMGEMKFPPLGTVQTLRALTRTTPLTGLPTGPP